ncbi:MAG: hypothetical protein H6742_15240 [Alphaproteobacteria bacterium]|nr:hypothetical protein [Alphaproteobacteria bacterium]
MHRKTDDTFWISYADLATGTMVVFLIVAAVMIAANQQREDERKREVEELAEEVRVILGTRAKLAESLRQALADESSVSVDPVTAQLVFEQSDQTVKFEKEGEVELDDDDKAFIERFAPKYICALWKYERNKCKDKEVDDCQRIDPEAPQGVRRILVAGHADLLGTSRENLGLSAERAKAVVDHALATLEMDPAATFGGNSLCAAHADQVRAYAHERLVSVGAGDIEHCRRSLQKRGGWTCEDNPLRGEREQAERGYRRVTFELELTGADMTGLIDDLLELRQVTGSTASTAPDDGARAMATLEQIRAQVAERCSEDMNAYHGCASIRNRCEERIRQDGERPAHCAGFDLEAGTEGAQ